jgi:hypothetical protein
LAAIVLFTAGIGYYEGLNSRVTPTASTTTIEPSTSLAGGAAVISRSIRYWNFKVVLNPTVVAKGQEINETFSLTNVSGGPLHLGVTSPLCNPAIYTIEGKLLWIYERPEVQAAGDYENGTGPGDSVNVPTSELEPGQNYVLSTFPLAGVGNQNLGPYLEINATLEIIQ